MARQREQVFVGLLRRTLSALPAVVVLAVLCMGSLIPPSQAMNSTPTSECPSGCIKPGGHVRVESASSLQVGSEVTIAIQLQNITDLYGVEIQLSFNPGILQVQDDKAGTVGIQIQPGDVPDPQLCFVVQNAADNAAGIIAYGVSLLRPSPPATGSGVLARFRFKGLAAGTSNVSITRLSIVASDSCCLDVTKESGSITVVSPTPTGGTVTGRVLVQGRSNYSGATVTIGGRQAVTGPDGTFSITNVSAGTYTVSASIASYLRAEKSGVAVTNGSTVTLPDVTLLAGDVDNNCAINIIDLAILGSAFGSSPPTDPRVDFNQDNRVNVLDLSLLSGNFGRVCPGPW